MKDLTKFCLSLYKIGLILKKHEKKPPDKPEGCDVNTLPFFDKNVNQGDIPRIER